MDAANGVLPWRSSQSTHLCRTAGERVFSKRHLIGGLAAASLAASGFAFFVVPANHASAATVAVPCTHNNATDIATLKAAITAANTTGGQTLSLTAGCTYTLSTVDNTGNEPNGLPKITSHMTIIGNGDIITRSTAGGTPAFEFFEVTSGGDLSLSNVVLSHGANGALYGGGPLRLAGIFFDSNASPGGDGGAIFSRSLVTVVVSTFRQNSARDGGAISSESGVGTKTLIILSSTFFLNTAAATDNGGAIHTDNPTVVINSTFTGNSAPDGGAIYDNNAPDLAIFDSTIADNTATDVKGGGGIANRASADSLTVANTIVADNSQGNCGSAVGLDKITDSGHNLENGASCGFTKHAVNAEPALGALSFNGGLTSTRAITSSSPAFQAGDPAVCKASGGNGAGGVDQRGFKRKTATACDIGAFELLASTTTPTPTPTAPARPTGTPLPIPSTGAGSGGPAEPATGALVAALGVLLLGAAVVMGRSRRRREAP
jgi:hypothetical protein